MFCDESTIQQFVTRERHTRRPTGKRCDERYTDLAMKHSLGQMIWGAMSSHGTTGLYFLVPNTTINGSRYVEMLAKKLDSHMHIYEWNIFVHDEVPCHRFKVACGFFRKHKIQVLQWPENSP